MKNPQENLATLNIWSRNVTTSTRETTTRAWIYDVRMAQFVLKIQKLSHIMGPRASQDLWSPSPIMAPGTTQEKWTKKSGCLTHTVNLDIYYSGCLVKNCIPLHVVWIFAHEDSCIFSKFESTALFLIPGLPFTLIRRKATINKRFHSVQSFLYETQHSVNTVLDDKLASDSSHTVKVFITSFHAFSLERLNRFNF